MISNISLFCIMFWFRDFILITGCLVSSCTWEYMLNITLTNSKQIKAHDGTLPLFTFKGWSFTQHQLPVNTSPSIMTEILKVLLITYPLIIVFDIIRPCHFFTIIKQHECLMCLFIVSQFRKTLSF